MKFVDGTEEVVSYQANNVGTIGIDLDMGKARVFDWEQELFEAKKGYGLSQGLLELLKGKEVDHIYVGGQYHPITVVEHEMEVLEPHDEFFDTADRRPREPQYIVR